MQISKITYKSAKYPELLREISSPPKQLYVRGELPVGEYVAIVGSRTPTKYGEENTYKIAYDLARAGAVIVSGLAYGVDAIAHRATLDAGGQAVAVVASGLDKVGPMGNRSLAAKIIENGAIITEYDLGMDAFKQNFVARNRIIAGIAKATIVTEANASSGALITANNALHNNRLVFAVPGRITDARSAGPNNLLRNAKAAAITSAYDVVELLELEDGAALRPVVRAESREEAALIELMGQGINNAEELIQRSELSASQFATIISLMEITGKVRNLGAGFWSLR